MEKIRSCYCKERKTNPKLAESLKELPAGYCGLCEICGEPGHTCAHPRLPTTSAWCDTHWAELNQGRIFTLADLIQPLWIGLMLLILGYYLWTWFVV